MKFENQYSLADQWLHRFSFASAGAQIGLADMEESLYKEQLAAVDNSRPVFVTALPRAGTTLLLNLLVETGEFASHTYRDMPFVLCPMLWHKFSDSFRTESEARERAHGDGVSVSVDSAEALEEILWQPFWGGHYKDDRIKPWKQGNNEDFKAFFSSHQRKIIALRFPQGHARYASKNNLNIARLRALQNLTPDCTIIVPFREPLQHAGSLLRQHLGFLDMHEQDPFSKRYMAGTGHFDFGANLKPIDFNNWLDGARHRDARTLGFWLEYWAAAYEHVLEQRTESVQLLSFEALVTKPAEKLPRLGAALDLAVASNLTDQARDLRAPSSHDIDTQGIDKQLLERTRDIHTRLLQHAL